MFGFKKMCIFAINSSIGMLNQIKRNVMKKNLLFCLIALMFCACEKPEPNPDPIVDVEDSTDYREQWEGRYWTEGMSQHRIWIMVDSTSSTKMSYRNSINMVTSVPVEVTRDGQFSYHQDSLYYIDGYFFGTDSMYVCQKIRQYSPSGSGMVENKYRCQKMNPNIPEPTI